MSGQMKISVVTVSLNSADTIDDTLRSVATQTYPDVEHIIVDGVSQDGTLDIVKRYDHVARVVSEPDQGVYDAMNKGIGLATGDAIGTLNADDVYADDQVAQRVAEVFEDSDVGACYADLYMVDRNDLQRVVRYWKARPFRRGLFSLGWVPAHSTFFVRREVYQEFGRFDLSYPIAADFELMLRLLEKHRVRTVNIPSIMVRMRLGGVSNRSLRNIFKGNCEILRAFRKNSVPISPLWPFSKPLVKALQHFKRFEERKS
jgi:glycosyltransferase involved in cell wall biosynthesis